jgi:putative endonuclease
MQNKSGARIALGRAGEDLAVDYLRSAGYRLVARNWRCRAGEIDVIVEGPGVTVFVEVKTRSGTGYGSPLEAVTPVKLARLRRLAGEWTAVHRPRGALRIDVIGIVHDGERPLIDHLEGVG